MRAAAHDDANPAAAHGHAAFGHAHADAHSDGHAIGQWRAGPSLLD